MGLRSERSASAPRSPDAPCRAPRALGLVGAFGGRHAVATMLAIARQPQVRAGMLPGFGGSQSGLLPFMKPARAPAELCAESGSARPDRLEAWLAVGVELGELGRRGDRYVVAGRRARALCGRQPTAHRALPVDAGVPVRPLCGLARAARLERRTGVETTCELHARTIAEVSLAAAAVHHSVPARDSSRRLARGERWTSDAGLGCTCAPLLEADPADPRRGHRARAPTLASEAAARLNAAGSVRTGRRSRGRRPRSGSLRRQAPSTSSRCATTSTTFRTRRSSRAVPAARPSARAGGLLVITTMTSPGSTAQRTSSLHVVLPSPDPRGFPAAVRSRLDLRDAGFAGCREHGGLSRPSPSSESPRSTWSTGGSRPTLQDRST